MCFVPYFIDDLIVIFALFIDIIISTTSGTKGDDDPVVVGSNFVNVRRCSTSALTFRPLVSDACFVRLDLLKHSL